MANFRKVKSIQIVVKSSWNDKPMMKNYESLKNDVRPCEDNEYFSVPL